MFQQKAEILSFRPAETYRPGEILIPSNIIQTRLKEMAPFIVNRYRNQKLIVVGILKGAFMVTADLVRELQGLYDLQVDFITAESYGSDTQSSGKIEITKDMSINPLGRHVLLVDDIIDTTLSLATLHKHVQNGGALSVATFALLSKPDRHKSSYRANFVAFSIPEVWVQGYGMDSDQYGRHNSNIIIGPVIP